MNKTL